MGLKRVASPFDDGLSHATAATPTCSSCCCCCCCLATIVSTPVVTTMIANGNAKARGVNPAKVGTLAFFAPIFAAIGVIVATVVGVDVTDSTGGSILLYPIPLLGIGILYACFRQILKTIGVESKRAAVGWAVGTGVASAVAFGVELVGGAMLLLSGAGLLYPILAIGATVVIITIAKSMIPKASPAALSAIAESVDAHADVPGEYL